MNYLYGCIKGTEQYMSAGPSDHQRKKVTRKPETVYVFDAETTSSPQPEANLNTYRKIIEKSDALIFTHDLSGKFLTINQSVLSSLGYNYEQLNGTFVSKIIPERMRSEFTKGYLEKLNKEGRCEGIFQFVTKAGKRKHWLYHSNIFTEVGQHPFVICFAQDVSKRVDIEEALKLSNETFRSAFDHSGLGMALINPQGQILDANSAITSMLGYTKAELISKNFLSFTHPEDNPTDNTMLHSMLMKVISHYSIEKRYVSKSSKIIWTLHTVSKVSNIDGTPKFFILQLVDITRKKQLTEELNRRNAELETIKNTLVEKINQLEELNYIIAHNLRGPANNIKMLVEMLKQDGEPHQDSGLQLTNKEIVNFLDEGSESLVNSLNTLMDVVQISMTKTIAHDDCDVVSIIGEILSQLNSSIFEKKAKILQHIEVERVLYPKVYLESILYNLISNALKYSSMKRTPQILVRTFIQDGHVYISVKDNGLGLDLDKYGKKLFKLNQIFHPGHDSKGVGLYITKAQIESFGGSISVTSKVDEGAEFLVKLY